MTETLSDQARPNPLSWELEQLNELYQHRPELVNAALRRLMAEDPSSAGG